MNTWKEALAGEKEKPYFQQLMQKIRQERETGTLIFPAKSDVFKAFKLTEFATVRVVILGQDPYHNINQANGLAFSVPKGIKTPPSLNNIYQELSQDISGFQRPEHGDLTHWAKQGVLLLNTVLTVRANQANSHAQYGWETFTHQVIEQLNQHREHIVFMLWGAPAQKKGASINRQKHLVLTAPHPSPLSAYRGFFGCKHFSKANEYLKQHHLTPIDWQP